MAKEDESKPNFKNVDSVISDKHVEYNRKKLQFQLTNMFVYDLETFNTDKIVPYANCINRFGKNSGKQYRDTTEREYEKCRKDRIVFERTNSIHEMLDHSKENPKELKINVLKIIHTY